MTNNWLTKFDQSKQIATTKKAQLAAQQKSFAQKVQALRAATGKIESRRVHFRCARTSGGFYADFERMNPGERFRIARIERDVPAAGKSAGFMAGIGLKPARADTAFDHREFDTSGWYCPWCNLHGIFVHCGACGENVCKARTTTRADGEEWFICTPACGNAGTLTQTDKIHGTKAPRPDLLASAKRAQHKTLPGKARSAPALPPNRINRLLGGPRQ